MGHYHHPLYQNTLFRQYICYQLLEPHKACVALTTNLLYILEELEGLDIQMTRINMFRCLLFVALLLVISKASEAKDCILEGETMTSNYAVEHAVLILVKENTTTEKIQAMISAIQGLGSLPQVQQLSVGAITSEENVHTDLKYTHGLHGRYADRQALAEYYPSKEHVGVTQEHIVPIMSDILVFDWEAQLHGYAENSLASSTYGAVRIQLLKPKADLDENSRSLLKEALVGYKDAFACVRQVSIGENFSPGRAKGFSLAFMMLFKGAKEMEELNGNEEHVRIQKEKVIPYVESSLAIEYFADSTNHVDM